MIAIRWNFNICFHVWGSFHLVFAVRAPKKRCDYFWPVFWPENAFSPFSYTGGLLVCKNEKLNCFDIHCVVEASSFSLNHNMTLESKESYPRHTKIVQNSLGFMPEVKPLHKLRGDLVLCALNTMEWRPYCPSRVEVSYCTFGFGAIMLRDLRTLSLPRDSPCNNQYACVIWVHTRKETHA